MDKREIAEMIERVLMRLNEYMDGCSTSELAEVIAEQAIVAEVKISHETYPSEHTAIDITCPTGHHGTPGKALAIILPLGEE